MKLCLDFLSYILLFQVALNQWLHHNMDTVVSMYEDRFDLCTLEKQPINLPDSSQTEKQSWWRNLTQQPSKTMSHELHCIVISHFSMPVKRTKELRALIGWYVFSFHTYLGIVKSGPCILCHVHFMLFIFVICSEFQRIVWILKTLNLTEILSQ